MNWSVISTDTEVNSMPNNDLKEHLESEKCWCKPRVEYHDKTLIMHNSADKREYFEPDSNKIAEIIN